MGGYNSGRRYGRPLAGEAFRIDLAWMIRTGHAVPGQSVSGSLRWTVRGEPCGSISYEAAMVDEAEARLILSYTRGSGDTAETVRQHVQLESTRPHFGGRRWWMLCPATGQRCAKLYLPQGGDRFAGRAAWRLGYQSQRDARHQKPFERLFRLQRRLGCPMGYEAFIRRPKGMWHRTYERHVQRYWELDERCATEWAILARRS